VVVCKLAFSEDMKVYYYTDPQNFRNIVDKLETAVQVVVVAAAVAVVATGQGQATPDVVAAAVAATATTKTLVTKGTTAGLRT